MAALRSGTGAAWLGTLKKNMKTNLIASVNITNLRAFHKSFQ
jgi:hypothetical protein